MKPGLKSLCTPQPNAASHSVIVKVIGTKSHCRAKPHRASLLYVPSETQRETIQITLVPIKPLSLLLAALLLEPRSEFKC